MLKGYRNLHGLHEFHIFMDILLLPRTNQIYLTVKNERAVAQTEIRLSDH